MRLICAILAIFVLFLSVQPVCGMALTASEDGCCEPSIGNCSSSDDQSGETPHDDCRNCNPFQACACCAPAVMPVPEMLLVKKEVPILPEAHNPVSDVHCPKGQGSGFWQPPRVA